MCKEQAIDFDMSGPLIQFILIPDYSENQSIFLIKFHHVMMDGLALTTVLQAIADEYDYKNINGLKPIPFVT